MREEIGLKIGTITFHWATNYGAVLQAYALQKYLRNCGYEATIIDYRPRLVVIKQSLVAIKSLNLRFFKCEKRLQKFRKKYLVLTARKYPTSNSLKKELFQFDYLIAGSDQIWNESFTLRGEGKPTLSYFLDFAKPGTKRIGYAISFGFSSPSEQYIKTVRDEIALFDAISVREIDGKRILKDLNIESDMVCDPTALLSREEYCSLAGESTIRTNRVFSYILRDKQTVAWKVANYIEEKYGSPITDSKFSGSMEDWLNSIMRAEIVVTNSFHGTLLSVILNRPFIAVTIHGSGMNSRLYSMLSFVGLSSRIVEEYSETQIQALMLENIDWARVNERMLLLRSSGAEFLRRTIESKN